MILKTCRTCTAEKAIDQFPKNKSNKDGFSNDCSICRNQKNRDAHKAKREKEKLLNPDPIIKDGHKICYSCKIEKPFSKYGKNKHIVGGLENKCKDCRNAYQKIINNKKDPNKAAKRNLSAPSGYKICTKCNLTKLHCYFGKTKLTKDGLEGSCGDCRKAKRAKAAAEKQGKIAAGLIHLSSKTCSRCKKTLGISSFSSDASRGDGYETKCKSCKGLYHMEYGAENKDKIKKRQANYFENNREEILAKNKEKYHNSEPRRLKTIRRTTKNGKTFNGRFSTYRSSARVRNVNFNLSKDQFKTFWQQPCSYCHSEIETIGIDRVDSSLGYSMDNCVPCCAYCNYIKNALSTEAFFIHVSKVQKFSEDGIIEDRKPRIFKTGNTKNDYYLTVDGKFSYYKGMAKKRNINFGLSLNQFKSFWQKPCSYCGSTIDTIGIDRIDSSKAYNQNNCIPCCTTCNSMKNDKSDGEFKTHINLIYSHITY